MARPTSSRLRRQETRVLSALYGCDPLTTTQVSELTGLDIWKTRNTLRRLARKGVVKGLRYETTADWNKGGTRRVRWWEWTYDAAEFRRMALGSSAAGLLKKIGPLTGDELRELMLRLAGHD